MLMMPQTPKRPPESLERSSPETAEKKQKIKKEIYQSLELEPMITDSLRKSPSKVLHVRNLPVDCTESELIASASPFGRVTNVLILKGKNQAFIEMEREVFATSLIEYYTSIQASIRGKPIYFQYSTRTEVSSLPDTESSSPILLVTVLNLVYPITIEILHQVFSRYGDVQKIVIFQKKAGFQSLIQFSKEEYAANAKRALDGQNIYTGCCTLRVQYSANVHELNIKVNNDRSRDYINKSIPSVPSSPLIAYGQSQSAPGIISVAPSSNAYGSNYFNQTQAQVQGQPQAQVQVQAQAQPPAPAATSTKSQQGNSQPNSQVVCFVRNLDPNRITPDALFTLFGVYGNVIRVKILFHKPNTALVQFENQQQCQTAIHYLNNCPLHDKKILLNYSTNNNISFQKGDEDSDKHTRDYSTSSLHRFRIEGSKNFANIAPPSSALHVSNLDLNVSEDILRRLFTNYGNVLAIKTLSSNSDSKRMAIVQMEDVAQAVDALINLHNYRFENSSTCFRVSFSKFYNRGN